MTHDGSEDETQEKRHHARPDLIDHARDMRKNATAAERILWSQLRGKKLGGFRFRRQHPIGNYIADFFCSEARLIIELDGQSHIGRETYDQARTSAIESLGFRVMRFQNLDVIRNIDNVLATILSHTMSE